MLFGHTVVAVAAAVAVEVVRMLSVGNLWELGSPGCSCSTDCTRIHIVGAAVAAPVVVGAAVADYTTGCLTVAAGCTVAGHSFVGSAASVAVLTAAAGETTDVDDILLLHRRHNLHHHTHLDKTTKHVSIFSLPNRNKSLSLS